MSKLETGISTSINKKHVIRRRETLELTSMCWLPIMIVFLFSYLPMFGLVLAFKDYRFDQGFFGSAWCGLKNFEFLVKSGDFGRLIRNTVGLNMFFIATHLVACVAVAILLFEVRSRTKIKLYQTSMILPHFISWVIAGYIFYSLLNPAYGIVNNLLASFGLQKIDWYSNPQYWIWILMLANLWKGIGIGSVTYYASLMGIDDSYFEAAALDGASKFQIIRYITIPFLIPLMTILSIMDVGRILRADFGLFYQISRDSGVLYSVTDVLDTYIYRSMKTYGDMKLSSAAGFLQSVVGFVMVLVTNYIVIKIEPDYSLF